MMNAFPSNDNELGRWIQSQWHMHKKVAILGLCILFGALFSWQQYRHHKDNQSREASLLLNNMIDLVQTNQPFDQIEHLEEQLVNNYPRTPYAALAKMLLAKSYIHRHQIKQAIDMYEAVIGMSNDRAIDQIAHLRLARLWIEENQGEKALAVLGRTKKWDFETPYYEVQGDAYWQMGDHQQARKAYQQALTKLPGTIPNREAIELRLQQKANHMQLNNKAPS